MIYTINDRSVKQAFRERELSKRGNILRGRAVAVFTTGYFLFHISNFVLFCMAATYCLFLFLEIWQTSSWVMPKLSQSNVAFRDITWDPVNKQVNN